MGKYERNKSKNSLKMQQTVENLDNKIKELWPKDGPSSQEVEKYIKKLLNIDLSYGFCSYIHTFCSI